MVSYRMYREEDDTEDLYNILETYLMQVITSASLVLLPLSSPLYSSHILFPSYLPSLLTPPCPLVFSRFSLPTSSIHPPSSPSCLLSPLLPFHFLLGLLPFSTYSAHPSHSHAQAENILSEIQKLRELIDQSESVILINLDIQRNIMLRLGLQLEMGMFFATISGLIGMAFGMNLQSSLEEVCVC